MLSGTLWLSATMWCMMSIMGIVSDADKGPIHHMLVVFLLVAVIS